MWGQILDVTLVAAPKQCKTNTEKADLRAGRIPEGWQGKSSKLSHKDRHARWTLKFTKAKQQDDGSMPSSNLIINLIILPFGYRPHISINRQFRFIRKWKTTDAVAGDGALLREACWIKPTRPLAFGQARPIAQKPMRISWNSRALSQRFTGKSRISSSRPSISFPTRNRRRDSLSELSVSYGSP